MTPQRMHYAGFCRLCGTGPLGLRFCGECENVVVLCDECDAVWTDADFTAPAILGDSEELNCPHCETSLLSNESHWATAEELLQSSWVQDGVASGALAIEVGEAFEPEINSLPTDLPEDS